MLRLTPHVYLTTLTSQRLTENGAPAPLPSVTFTGGLSATYYHWFGVDGTADNVEGDLDLHLAINPGRPVALLLDERFTRTARPYADNFGGLAPSYGRNTNAVGATGVFSTTGGVLSGRLGYTFVYDFFDSTAFNYGNNFDHQFLMAGSFRFLPRTAIVYDLNADYMALQPGGGPVSALLSNGFRLTTRIGLNGAFTSRLSASAMVGYGAGFYQTAAVSDYESLVAQLEEWAAFVVVDPAVPGEERIDRGLDRLVGEVPETGVGIAVAALGRDADQPRVARGEHDGARRRVGLIPPVGQRRDRRAFSGRVVALGGDADGHRLAIGSGRLEVYVQPPVIGVDEKEELIIVVATEVPHVPGTQVALDEVRAHLGGHAQTNAWRARPGSRLSKATTKNRLRIR